MRSAKWLEKQIRPDCVITSDLVRQLRFILQLVLDLAIGLKLIIDRKRRL